MYVHVTPEGGPAGPVTETRRSLLRVRVGSGLRDPDTAHFGQRPRTLQPRACVPQLSTGGLIHYIFKSNICILTFHIDKLKVKFKNISY